MTSPPGADSDDISGETLAMAARVRARAARMPDAAEITGMAMDAPRGDMSPDEIRALAIEAVRQAQQVSWLLGKLAGLLDQPAGDPGGH